MKNLRLAGKSQKSKRKFQRKQKLSGGNRKGVNAVFRMAKNSSEQWEKNWKLIGSADPKDRGTAVIRFAVLIRKERENYKKINGIRALIKLTQDAEPEIQMLARHYLEAIKNSQFGEKNPRIKEIIETKLAEMK